MKNNENFSFNDNQKSFKGRVKVFEGKDDFENLIIEKDNLIVLRGRAFALEQMFKERISASDFIYNPNRIPCLFKIGSGGANIGTNGINGTPFVPYIPEFDNTDLGNPVPFITINPNKNSNETLKNNPSVYTSMPSGLSHRYYLGKTMAGGITEYYGKIFEAGSSYLFDQSKNTVCRKIDLKIDTNEARGQLINEFGLVLAELDTTNKIAIDAELMTRVTIPTRALNNLDYLRIEYYIYA